MAHRSQWQINCFGSIRYDHRLLHTALQYTRTSLEQAVVAFLSIGSGKREMFSGSSRFIVARDCIIPSAVSVTALQ